PRRLIARTVRATMPDPMASVRTARPGGLLAAALIACTAGAVAAAPVPITIGGDPAAPALMQPGTGLCVTSNQSIDPATDFAQSVPNFNGSVNLFIEAHAATRVTSVLRSVFDL